ncbi:MAG: hypothetical protein JWO42_1119 [Chloroflexi bacterium]|nr:hypothetical protein [Chloroflexota bacterium]
MALSLRSPSLGVTQHPGTLELGLSSDGNAARGRPAWLRHRSAYHALEGGSILEISAWQSEAELTAFANNTIDRDHAIHLLDELL